MIKGSTQAMNQHPTHALSAAKQCCKKGISKERTTMRTTGRYRQLMPTLALATIVLCTHLVNGRGGESVATGSNHGLRGIDSFQDLVAESQGVDVIDDMCNGRPRNNSMPWGHDDDWYSQCHAHWTRADSIPPKGQWTQAEFIEFVELQSHSSFSKFRDLPLPLTMIFNELSCRCLAHESSDCCHGSNAKIVPGDNVVTWMDTICDRVDNALDEVCRRQRKRARGSEL